MPRKSRKQKKPLAVLSAQNSTVALQSPPPPRATQISSPAATERDSHTEPLWAGFFSGMCASFYGIIGSIAAASSNLLLYSSIAIFITGLMFVVEAYVKRRTLINPRFLLALLTATVLALILALLFYILILGMAGLQSSYVTLGDAALIVVGGLGTCIFLYLVYRRTFARSGSLLRMNRLHSFIRIAFAAAIVGLAVLTTASTIAVPVIIQNYPCGRNIPNPIMTDIDYSLNITVPLPSKIKIYVADFDGPESRSPAPAIDYRVGSTIYEMLTAAFASNPAVEVLRLNKVIPQGDIAMAKAEGIKDDASVLIWGWYEMLGSAAPVNVEFSILKHPAYMPQIDQQLGMSAVLAPGALDSFSFQLDAANQMTYLSNFTVGTYYYSAGEPDKALTFFNLALGQLNKPNPQLESLIHYFSGNALIGLRNFAGAEEELGTSVNIMPMAVGYLDLGNAHLYQNEYADAASSYSTAIRCNPQMAAAFTDLALVDAGLKQPDKAIADAQRAINIRGNNASAHYVLGYLYQMSNDDDKALESYSDTIAYDRVYTEAYVASASIYSARGEQEKAIAIYNDLIKIGPQDAQNWVFRGSAYYAKGEYALALDDYNQAISLDKHNADALEGRGAVYSAEKKYAEAIADFKNAITLEPSPDVFFDLGLALVNIGDLNGAIDAYNQAIMLKNDFDKAYYGQGRAYELKGSKNEAIADFREVLKINESSDLCSYARQELASLGVQPLRLALIVDKRFNRSYMIPSL